MWSLHHVAALGLQSHQLVPLRHLLDVSNVPVRCQNGDVGIFRRPGLERRWHRRCCAGDRCLFPLWSVLVLHLLNEPFALLGVAELLGVLVAGQWLSVFLTR